VVGEAFVAGCSKRSLPSFPPLTCKQLHGGLDARTRKSKYLAIGSFAAGATPIQIAALLPDEVSAILQLNVDGKMDQFWLRHDGKGVVFVMTTEASEFAVRLKFTGARACLPSLSGQHRQWIAKSTNGVPRNPQYCIGARRRGSRWVAEGF